MNHSIVEIENVVVEPVSDGVVDVVASQDVAEAVAPVSAPETARDVEISCDPIPASLREALSFALESLRLLKAEIVQKIEFAWRREEALENRLEQLMRDTGSTDEQRKKVLGESVAMYTGLLRSVIAEIDEELTFFGPFAAEAHPHVVKVPVGAADETSTLFFERSVKLLKSQSKNIRKYLAVSYSRYMYGFDLQERNLEQLEYKITTLLQYRQVHKAA